MLTRILIPILILAIGCVATWWVSRPPEEPAPVHVPPQKLKTAVLEIQRDDYQVVLDSQGVVRAHHETTLTATVDGTVAVIHPAFEDGAFFKAGEILVELDPADFTAALESARSQVARAEAAHAQEEARARQARLNWEDLGYDEEPSELVLRIPQLKESRANVDAAKAALTQAERNLEKSKVRAPFDGRVRSRMVGLGQAISASTALGQVFATDFAEVRLPLTPDQLEFIDLPSKVGDAPVPVLLTDGLAAGRSDNPATWEGSIVRTEGTLDASSRELFVIARVDDPFGLKNSKPPLRIGQPVRAAIHGHVLKDVFVIPRNSLRGVNRIYLVDRDEPAIRRAEIEPIWTTTEDLVIRDGLEEGQWLAITRLPYAPDGAPVEVVEETQEESLASPTEPAATRGS